jgi:DNA repair protein SbcD/Mre11
VKLLVLSDTQIGSGQHLHPDRLADQERMLEQIADLADEEQVDAVIHCGDVFHSRHPSEEARLVFKRWAHRVGSGRRKPHVIVTAGNHDLRNAELPSSIDLYDDCTFVRRPHVFGFDVSLACLPWTPPHTLVASKNGASRETMNTEIAELLLASARDLRGAAAQRFPDVPCILALHWAISGSSLPNGIAVDDLPEPVIPLDGLLELGFSAVVGGHIHNPQVVKYEPPVLVCGSTWVNDWSEVRRRHGVWILDTERLGEFHADDEFRPLDDRLFVTLTYDLVPSGEDWVTSLLAQDYDQQGGRDAIVRVTYRATAEQAQRIDQAALTRALLDAGAVKVTLVPDIVRESRPRVEGLTEDVGETEAVDAWLAAAGVDSALADKVRERHGRYAEAVA